ncbi:hypothetical protein BC835DRAFT_1309260 [Cytidiella melzeri]|nr:hypothetical protein BC835DRAFT_1309260 [Cytidiella melzeri]
MEISENPPAPHHQALQQEVLRPKNAENRKRPTSPPHPTMHNIVEGDVAATFKPRLTAVYVTIHQQTEQVVLCNYTHTQSDDNRSSSQESSEDVEVPQFDESVLDSQESIHLAPTWPTEAREVDVQDEREEIADREETTQAAQEMHRKPAHTNNDTWTKILFRKIWKWLPSPQTPMTQFLQGQLDIKRTHSLGSPTGNVVHKPGRSLYRGARVAILTPENLSPNHVFRIAGVVGSVKGRLVIAAKPMRGKQNILIVVDDEDYSPPLRTKLMRRFRARHHGYSDNFLGEMEWNEEEELPYRLSTQTWAE